jgi:hypothetical protein
MTEEIRAHGLLEFDDGQTKVSLDHGPFRPTSTNKQVVKHVQNIGTSEEAIDIGELTMPGLVAFFNKDATNYVDIYLASGDTNSIRIKALESAGPVRLTAQPYAKANTATINLEYMIVED